MFGQKLILISLILLEFTVERCSVQRLTSDHTNWSSKSFRLSLNSSNVVNSSSIRNESTSGSRTVHLKSNKTSRLQEEDESDDNEDYPDNEGIDDLNDEGADQEEGNIW